MRVEQTHFLGAAVISVCAHFFVVPALAAEYVPGLARQISLQGEVISIQRVIRDGAYDWEKKACESESVTDGAVRQYLAIADDVNVDSHDFDNTVCSFLVSIRFNGEIWQLDLNISGLSYLRTGPSGGQVLGCGSACAKFLHNAESAAETCLHANDGC